MTQSAHWQLTEEDHVATLTLCRRDAKNSLLPETLKELREITEHLRSDSGVWAVVVQGEGDHFSTGVDLSTIGQVQVQDRAHFGARLREMQTALDEFEALEKPTIAKLRGFCIGGGVLLALCCDFRIASQKTYFALPEVRLGMAVVMGTQRIVRCIGSAAATELILLGERIGAPQALSLGLVHRVVAPDELDAAVATLADKFRRLPPRTIAIAKRLINFGVHRAMRESQDAEIEAQAELLDSPDMQEAFAAYTEKRVPQFRRL